jgi:hypothetical protein
MTTYNSKIDEYQKAVNRYNETLNTKSKLMVEDLTAELNDVSQEVSKEYYLFVIWLFITIIILILTMITVIYKNEVNTLVWIISIIFILYSSFFIFKNIYSYTVYDGTG